MKRLLPLLIVAGILGAFVWTLFFLHERSQPKPPEVRLESPSRTDIVQKTVATGAIVPRREVAIKSRVAGILEKLAVSPGDHVEADALIATIKLVPDALTLSRAENAVDTARIALENAERELKRNQDLVAKGVVSDTEFQRLKLEDDLKRRELEGAENDLALIRVGASRKSGQVSNLVRSTVAGTVLDAPVKEGESVIESNTFNAGTTIASIADMGDLIFLGKVDESEVGKLREGMDLTIRIGALEEKTLSGKLEYVAPKGATNEGTIQFEIRAALEKHDGLVIRAGYSANADIVVDRRKDVLAISEKLLQFEDGKPFVEVELGPRQFARRYVKTGLSDGNKIEILGGVDAKARIKDPVETDEDKAPAPRGLGPRGRRH
jgi:HlyD family secretion protein